MRAAPDLSPEALARLEEAARAATPGPWEGASCGCILTHDATVADTHPGGSAEEKGDSHTRIAADAAYIAAASPDVVLALVQAARERERLGRALSEAICGLQDCATSVYPPTRMDAEAALDSVNELLDDGATE